MTASANPKGDRALLELSGVWRTYVRDAEAVVALAGVDLVVHQREIVAVVGRSGSGKSTLLHIAGGLDVPDKGTVRIAGSDPVTMSAVRRAELRRSAVGFVFQFFHLLPHLTVAENVELPLLLGRVGHARSKAMDALASVGMKERADRFPSELSGGEMQRAAVARAVVTGAPLILADEPTGNLDSATGGSVLDLLTARARDNDAALVLVTHDTAAAARADRIVTITDGRIADESRVAVPRSTVRDGEAAGAAL